MYTMKIEKGKKKMEDRLLYPTVYFDNKVTYFFQICNISTCH